jgi:CreA protein
VLIFSINLKEEEIEPIDTVFKFYYSNYKVVVETFYKPKIDGVTCNLSRAKIGGISGSLGISEDKA